MKFRICFALFSFCWLFHTVSVRGQIINDSTQMLYGPTTTRVLHEANFYRGNYAEVAVDTSFRNSYSPYFWFSDTTFQQTLGNIGLATKPLLFQLPNRIGARLGRNAFDLYAYHPENILYYNTRSPYTKLEFLQGTLGEGVFEGEFNRNITPWWNAGIAYRRITADKQIGGVRREQEVVHNGVKIYTHLQTTNNRYHLFAHFLNNNQKFVESGGIRVGADTVRSALFDYLDEPVNLRQATGREIRNSFHVGQTFALFGEPLKLFYNLDYRTQINRFKNMAVELEGNPAFYKTGVIYDSTQTHDKTVYREFENTVGITGNQKHYFYSAYLKNRNVNLDRVTHVASRPESLNQTFIGGLGELKVNEKIKTRFLGEYKLTDEYRVEAEVQVLFAGFRQTRMLYAPTLMQQEYYGNHNEWKNDFDNISADRSAVWIRGSLFHNFLELELANTSIRDYVFYDVNQAPSQRSASQSLQTLTLNHKFNLGKFNFENLVAYTNSSNAPVIRVPDFAIRSRLFYEGFILKKALFGQVGLEANYVSGYLADAYAPAIEQFYLQNNFMVQDYPVVDFFIGADIKSVNIFLKLAHANQGFPSNGYFTTPIYTGMQRSFIFGIKWQFFD